MENMLVFNYAFTFGLICEATGLRTWSQLYATWWYQFSYVNTNLIIQFKRTFISYGASKVQFTRA